MSSQKFINLNLLGAAVIGAFIYVGCESSTVVNNAGTGGTGGTDTTPTPSPTAGPTAAGLYDSELYFTVTTAWDQSLTDTSSWIPELVDGSAPTAPLPSACLIPFGEAPGSVNPAALTHTCKFTIPEAQLYLSQVQFAAGTTDSAQCKYMKFYPYFYELDDGLTPPFTGAVSTPTPVPVPWLISNSPTPVGCYGAGGAGYTEPYEAGNPLLEAEPIYSTAGCFNGAATAMITGFPGTGFSLLQETESSQQFTLSPIPSAFTSHQATNRWVSNDTANINAQGNAFNGEYLLGSMHGYNFQCFNEFGVLMYQTKITIAVESDYSGTNAAIYRAWR